MGNAHEHKCEQVLDLSHAPNPGNSDKCLNCNNNSCVPHLQIHWLKARLPTFLCECSDPQDKTKFGDARKICTNLCNFHKGSAMTCVSTAVLESHLTNVHLNEMWTKTVSKFVTAVSHLIQ